MPTKRNRQNGDDQQRRTKKIRAPKWTEEEEDLLDQGLDSIQWTRQFDAKNNTMEDIARHLEMKLQQRGNCLFNNTMPWRRTSGAIVMRLGKDSNIYAKKLQKKERDVNLATKMIHIERLRHRRAAQRAAEQEKKLSDTQRNLKTTMTVLAEKNNLANQRKEELKQADARYEEAKAEVEQITQQVTKLTDREELQKKELITRNLRVEQLTQENEKLMQDEKIKVQEAREEAFREGKMRGSAISTHIASQMVIASTSQVLQTIQNSMSAIIDTYQSERTRLQFEQALNQACQNACRQLTYGGPQLSVGPSSSSASSSSSVPEVD